jgi:hypothetical protein
MAGGEDSDPLAFAFPVIHNLDHRLFAVAMSSTSTNAFPHCRQIEGSFGKRPQEVCFTRRASSSVSISACSASVALARD